MTTRLTVLAVGLICLSVSTGAAQDNWPQFRGGCCRRQPRITCQLGAR